MRMNVKHIFFDLDHTLWDFETNSSQTFSFIFEKNGLGMDLLRFNEVYRPINQKYWKLYREDRVSKADLRYFRLRETFEALNEVVSDEMIHLLSEEYITYLTRHNALFANAIEVLSYLRERYRMHIITNGFEEVQHRKLQSSNLLPFFEHVITSEKVGVKKPDPRIFRYAMEMSGAEPFESVMVGDSFEADILGARNVGMQTIFCEFNGEVATEPVPTIANLLEIKEFL